MANATTMPAITHVAVTVTGRGASRRGTRKSSASSPDGGESARPAQPLQVVQAVRVGTEPGLELARHPRRVNSGARLIHGPGFYSG